MITDRMIDQAFSDLKGICGGVRNDYFGLLCLERDYQNPEGGHCCLCGGTSCFIVASGRRLAVNARDMIRCRWMLSFSGA